MGVLDKRLSQLAQSSKEHLEDGETPEVTVVVERLAGVDWSEALRHYDPEMTAGYRGGTTYAVVATQRHIYVMPIAGWAGVGDVEMKLPVGAVDIHLEKAFLGFRPDLNIGGTKLATMAGGKKSALRLIEHVSQMRAGAAGSEPTP